ncbi:MAG TPA: hypothetical protein VF533_02400 [Solirubrobacteraceae bacterium]|jgi:hypothetical protein
MISGDSSAVGVSDEELGPGDFALLVADAVFAAGRLGARAALDEEDLTALAFARRVLDGAAAFQRGEELRRLPLSGAGALDAIDVVAATAPDSNGSVAGQAEALAAMLGRFLEGHPSENDYSLLADFRQKFVALANRTLARAGESVSAGKEPMRWTSSSSTSAS